MVPSGRTLTCVNCGTSFAEGCVRGVRTCGRNECIKARQRLTESEFALAAHVYKCDLSTTIRHWSQDQFEEALIDSIPTIVTLGPVTICVECTVLARDYDSAVNIAKEIISNALQVNAALINVMPDTDNYQI